MTALTAPRLKTRNRAGDVFARKVAEGVTIYQGALVALSATGFATPGATATTLKADGIAKTTVDNSDGNDGDLTVEVEKGVFPFANSAAADAITIAEIGTDCYIVDDQTVAKTSGTNTRSVAGKVVDVDAAGVWVRLT
ncbi:hypothetical protein D1610_11635 [Sphingomonas gilva]|uniref:DUF2190 family protein n=1 Tax=Sphingomonas gilva TaxID=2305907 RepID=A0A396RLH0_9SPHN|nr:hypothetical protein [Sphingomonas gilva]RHW17194.1 hypothetical protein D1610_11635 [Sphingomonas gilva]